MKGSSKTVAKKVKPPLDFYGVSPTFYMDGEEKTSSWVGCLCSVVLGGIMIAIAVYYFMIFIRKEDLTVYSKVQTLEQFPLIDLKEYRFIVVVRGIYDGTEFVNQREQFLRFTAETVESVPEIIIPGALPFQYNAYPKQLIPCEQVVTDLSDLNVPKEQLHGALCIEFAEKFQLGGSFIDQLLRALNFNILPCKPEPPNITCMAQRYNEDGTPNGPPVSTIDISDDTAKAATLALISEYLSHFEVQFGYIEDSPGLDDFEKSMRRNLVFQNKLKINANYVSNHKYYMSQTVVETESGWFTSQVTKKTGLKLESSNLYMLSRRIDDTKTYIYTIDGVTALLTV